MAKKKVAAIVKIQIPAGQATPAPPVGTALGPHGVAIMDFCKAYNAADREPARHDRPGRDHDLRGPVVHVHHEDAAHALPAPAGRGHREGRGEPRDARGPAPSPTRRSREIAETKMPDLNAIDLDAAQEQVAGTARSMGIEIVE